MEAPVLHTIYQQKFWLSSSRCIFWGEQKALILSDLHFGKTGHFRKAGIAVPQSVYKEDLQRLVDQLHYFKPQKIIIVGDLFHSHQNLELDFFKRWRKDFPKLEMHLVKGNHDILKESWYKEVDILLHPNDLAIEKFRFTHEYCDTTAEEYTFCGHIHPGVAINGLGKQSLRFPCFYFTKDHCILPAFGKFTGLTNIAPKKNENIYAIVEKCLIKLQ